MQNAGYEIPEHRKSVNALRGLVNVASISGTSIAEQPTMGHQGSCDRIHRIRLLGSIQHLRALSPARKTQSAHSAASKPALGSKLLPQQLQRNVIITLRCGQIKIYKREVSEKFMPQTQSNK
jgi:hypothetical protein